MNKGLLESFSKIYSIVALRMRVFFFFIREGFKIILRLAWRPIKDYKVTGFVANLKLKVPTFFQVTDN